MRTLTLETVTTAVMPSGLQYGERVDWIARRDALLRDLAAASYRDTAELDEDDAEAILAAADLAA